MILPYTYINLNLSLWNCKLINVNIQFLSLLIFFYESQLPQLIKSYISAKTALTATALWVGSIIAYNKLYLWMWNWITPK